MSQYIYCAGGYPVSAIWKIDISDMSKIAESINYGGGSYDYADIYALTCLGDYIYCGGDTQPEIKVWKIRRSNMLKIAESIDYVGTIYALTCLGDYIYCGGSSPYKVWKIDPSDMSKIAESINYGGIIYALATDGTYIYCGGATTKTVWKIDPSNMSKIAESANYGGIIQDIVTDGTYIYCGGGTGGTYKVWKIDPSNMSKIAESETYGTTIRALTILGDYIYCGGLIGNGKVWKIDKSDMLKIAESANYGGTIRTLTNDGTYVYCGGYTATVNKVWKIDISDMSKISEIDYGAPISVLTYPSNNGDIVPPTVTTQEVTSIISDITTEPTISTVDNDCKDRQSTTLTATGKVTATGLTNTAVGNGTIEDTGGENCSKRGICYNTTGNPTIEDSKVEETGDFGIGAFTESLIDLSPDTTYYVKAYACNSAGYGYGEEVEFIIDTATEGYTFRGFEYYEKGTGEYLDSMYAVREIGVFPSTGEFEMTLYGLKPSTYYYIRAFAGNDIGINYGDWVLCCTKKVPTYDVYEEETTPTICFYVSEDGGHTWSLKFGPYTTDQADIAITKILVRGSGKKQIKFTTDALTGLSASVMCKVDVKI